jgi:sulfofructose kinase
MSRPPKVVAVGLAVMDKIFTVDGMPASPIKVFASSYAEIGGGPAATGSVAVARLGGAVDLWTRVGDDDIGRRLVRELRDWGVTPVVRPQKGVASNVSGVIVDRHGERMIISFTDPGLDPDPSWLPLDELCADAVLADVRWPEGSLLTLRRAQKLGIPTILDADLAPADVLDALLPHADFAIFSEPAIARYAATADRTHALAHCRGKCGGVVGVTLGAEGFLWLDGDRLIRNEGFQVPVVDTLGAGDVFHGAFALAVAEGRPTADAAAFANAASALKCTRPGGRAGIPARPEVEALLATQSPSAGSHAHVRT